ncbi:hypothetical protein CDAR_547211 [Caerostris darwini]|uniref:Uncharacterized protein n=1 Tax=Caerostris darwini TaxID=1538125 RepID=A0AAV4WWB6_9ARAC|nr:hypothetical protein CDAR_547211 [Caerostris darwini]
MAREKGDDKNINCCQSSTLANCSVRLSPAHLTKAQFWCYMGFLYFPPSLDCSQLAGFGCLPPSVRKGDLRQWTITFDPLPCKTGGKSNFLPTLPATRSHSPLCPSFSPQ